MCGGWLRLRLRRLAATAPSAVTAAKFAAPAATLPFAATARSAFAPARDRCSDGLRLLLDGGYRDRRSRLRALKPTAAVAALPAAAPGR